MLGKHEVGESRPGGSNPPVSANFMERILRWLRSTWYGERKKRPEEVVVHFKLPDKTKQFLEYQKQLHCREHENYSGATEPINGCNVCWQIYSIKKSKW